MIRGLLVGKMPIGRAAFRQLSATDQQNDPRKLTDSNGLENGHFHKASLVAVKDCALISIHKSLPLCTPWQTGCRIRKNGSSSSASLTELAAKLSKTQIASGDVLCRRQSVPELNESFTSIIRRPRRASESDCTGPSRNKKTLQNAVVPRRSLDQISNYNNDNSDLASSNRSIKRCLTIVSNGKTLNNTLQKNDVSTITPQHQVLCNGDVLSSPSGDSAKLSFKAACGKGSTVAAAGCPPPNVASLFNDGNLNVAESTEKSVFAISNGPDEFTKLDREISFRLDVPVGKDHQELLPQGTACQTDSNCVVQNGNLSSSSCGSGSVMCSVRRSGRRRCLMPPPTMDQTSSNTLIDDNRSARMLDETLPLLPGSRLTDMLSSVGGESTKQVAMSGVTDDVVMQAVEEERGCDVMAEMDSESVLVVLDSGMHVGMLPSTVEVMEPEINSDMIVASVKSESNSGSQSDAACCTANRDVDLAISGLSPPCQLPDDLVAAPSKSSAVRRMSTIARMTSETVKLSSDIGRCNGGSSRTGNMAVIGNCTANMQQCCISVDNAVGDMPATEPSAGSSTALDIGSCPADLNSKDFNDAANITRQPSTSPANEMTASEAVVKVAFIASKRRSGKLKQDRRSRKAKDVHANSDVRQCQWELGDVVWTKMLRTEPWWPSMIDCDPTDGSFTKISHRRHLYHVMFFGCDKRRGWISKYSILPFEASDNVRNHNQSSGVVNVDPLRRYSPSVRSRAKDQFTVAIAEADKAMLVEREKRLNEFGFWAGCDVHPSTTPNLFAVVDSEVCDGIDESQSSRKRHRRSSIGTPTPQRSRAKRQKLESCETVGLHPDDDDGGLTTAKPNLSEVGDKKLTRSRRKSLPPVRYSDFDSPLFQPATSDNTSLPRSHRQRWSCTMDQPNAMKLEPPLIDGNSGRVVDEVFTVATSCLGDPSDLLSLQVVESVTTMKPVSRMKRCRSSSATQGDLKQCTFAPLQSAADIGSKKVNRRSHSLAASPIVRRVTVDGSAEKKRMRRSRFSSCTEGLPVDAKQCLLLNHGAIGKEEESSIVEVSSTTKDDVMSVSGVVLRSTAAENSAGCTPSMDKKETGKLLNEFLQSVCHNNSAAIADRLPSAISETVSHSQNTMTGLFNTAGFFCDRSYSARLASIKRQQEKCETELQEVETTSAGGETRKVESINALQSMQMMEFMSKEVFSAGKGLKSSSSPVTNVLSFKPYSVNKQHLVETAISPRHQTCYNLRQLTSKSAASPSVTAEATTERRFSGSGLKSPRQKSGGIGRVRGSMTSPPIVAEKVLVDVLNVAHPEMEKSENENLFEHCATDGDSLINVVIADSCCDAMLLPHFTATEMSSSICGVAGSSGDSQKTWRRKSIGAGQQKKTPISSGQPPCQQGILSMDIVTSKAAAAAASAICLMDEDNRRSSSYIVSVENQNQATVETEAEYKGAASEAKAHQCCSVSDVVSNTGTSSLVKRKHLRQSSIAFGNHTMGEMSTEMLGENSDVPSSSVPAKRKYVRRASSAGATSKMHAVDAGESSMDPSCSVPTKKKKVPTATLR